MKSPLAESPLPLKRSTPTNASPDGRSFSHRRRPKDYRAADPHHARTPATCKESLGHPEEKERRSPILLELVVILLLILMNAVFAGAEIAIVSVRRTRVEALAEDGKSSARAVLSLKEHPEQFLATIQIGVTLLSATAAALGGATLAQQIAPWLATFRWLTPYAHDVALALVVIAVSYLSIVLGELVPKSLAMRGAETYSLVVARPLLGLSQLAKPVVWLLTASSNVVLRPFRDQTTFTETKYSAVELQRLMDEAAKAGTVNVHAGAIASRALDFERLTAGDVMIPRQDVIALPRRASVAEVHRILLEHAHTRLPVFEDHLDNVVGYVNVKDILAVAWDPRLFILEDLLRPAYFVPESVQGLDLLEDMRARHMPFAIVVDDQGGMSGIVTLDDLVEELVGEIVGEHAENAHPPIEREPDGSAIVSGVMPVREVNRELELELPERKDYSTIAGLCLALAGRIPSTGDKIEVAGHAELEIIDASRQRVRVVRIRPARSRGALV